MKKIISAILTVAMLITLVNIPVTIASEDAEVVNSESSVGLVDFTEDYTVLKSTDELVGWTLTPSDHSVTGGVVQSVGVVEGEGIKVNQEDIELFNDDGTSHSTQFGATLSKVLTRTVVDNDNRTVLAQKEFQGKFDVTLDITSNLVVPTMEIVKELNPDYPLTKFNAAYVNLTLGKSESRIRNGSVELTKPFSKTVRLSNVPDDSVIKYTIDTVEDKYTIDYNGTVNECTYGGDSVGDLKFRLLERFYYDTYFTVKSLKVKQYETDGALATLEVVNSLPASLVSNPAEVKESFIMPESVTGVTWSSSDSSVVSTTGTVTRGEEDKEVVITATVDLNNKGGVFTKEYTLTVPKVETPSGGDGGDSEQPGGDEDSGDDPIVPPVADNEKIIAYDNFTEYSDIDDVPRIKYENDKYAEVKAVKGKGIIVEQIDSAPLTGAGEANTASKLRLTHISEGTFKRDDENRTIYRTNRFSGKYRLTIEYELICEAYPDNKYDGVTVSGPFYQFKIGAINTETWKDTPALWIRGRSVANNIFGDSNSKSSLIKPNSISVTAGIPHTFVMDIDTNTRDVYANIDNGDKPASGPVTEVVMGYLNGFTITDMQKMQVGTFMQIKSVKYEELERDADTASAIAALDQLPASLVENPYEVTENIELPYISENVVWMSSDPSIISADGTVTRWYDDREVTLTASSTCNKVAVYKDYKLTVKAFDSYDKKEIMNNSGLEISDITVSGDTSAGSANVGEDGIVVSKIIDGDTASAEQEVYYADYRLFGEEVAYKESTKSDVLTAGYSGMYDVDFKLTPSITGDKPIYVALGNEAKTFNKIVALRVAKDSLSITHKDGKTKIYNGTTNGETFDIRYRIDTDNKLVWVFVNGKLSGSPFAYEEIEFVDSLRVILDKNNNKDDKVTLNNISVTEIIKNDISVRTDLLTALEGISVNTITSNANAVESIKNLPESVGDYEITWSSNSKQIDVENGKVYFSESEEDVVVSAMICADGVYVKKNFYLTVRAAKDSDEVLDGYISDLAQVITNQNPKDVRYDLNLPSEYNGVSIAWTSSNPGIISNSGKLNKDVVIINPVDITLTATISMDGTNYERAYFYTVSPRAYNKEVYRNSGDVETITVNGKDNIKITRDTVTTITFSQNGNGSIYLEDSKGRKIATINVNNDVYNVLYSDTVSGNYAIPVGEAVTLKIMVMPDIDRVAVWNEAGIIVDFGETIEAVENLSKIYATETINVSETVINTDEYGLLDINIENIGYFDVFAKNVVTENVDLVSDTVISADVKWKSSNAGLITDAGVVTTPNRHELAGMTLTLTSRADANIKRSVTKKFVVACPADMNYALNKATKSSVAEKPGFVKAYLTDGDYNTVYATTNANKKPVITIDFGKIEYFNTLFVNEDFGYYDSSLKSYTVSCSNDGETWKVVKEGTIDGIESALISFDTVSARYVSFTAQECDNKELYINEIEVYLFVNSSELMQLEVESLDFGVGSAVTEDLKLPKIGKFGTNLAWSSSHPEIISADGKVTRPKENTTVTLTVTARFGDEEYSKSYAAYVPAKSATGAKPVGGGSGGGGSAGGGYVNGSDNGVSVIPGFAETDITEKPVVTPDDSTASFNDLDSNHWAYENVMKLKELGIIDGIGNNEFNPSGKVTREQFLKMLVEAVDAEVKFSTTSFKDVDTSAWYAPYVSTGVELGLINGITDETFGVGAEIKRQDMAVLIVRILNNKGVVVTQTSELFDDENDISDYAKDAVYTVRDAGIIQGYNNEFNPMDSLTRAEAATVIVKLLEVMQ